MQSPKQLEEIMSSQSFSNFRLQQNYLESLLQYRFVGPTSRNCNLVDFGWYPKLCSLVSSQIMLMMVWGPHFKNYFSRQRQRLFNTQNLLKDKKPTFTPPVIDDKLGSVNQAPILFQSYYSLDHGLPIAAVKNPPAMQEPQETQVRSLGQEDPLEEGTHSSILVWRILDRGAWWYTILRVAKSWT